MSRVHVITSTYNGQCEATTRERPCCGPELRCMRMQGHEQSRHLWWSGTKIHTWSTLPSYGATGS